MYEIRRKKLKNGVSYMINMQIAERYCTVRESLIESCKEVKLMREGKLPKKTWKELRAELKNEEAEGK
ncbi:hypothetical protein [Anaerovorax sp. IOR16]|uniref:hypothetical protein n=1 Tax=Anaerovorax sp. IOR16 TaxID=2773458 RepID=UPI0019D228FF|nr:hypothetical protein [Anaerovorax sp. IOR16]